MFDGLPPDVLMKALKDQLPGMKTQAQLNAFMAGFDALRVIMSSIFTGDFETEAKARGALEQVFEIARASTHLGNQYAEVKDATTTVSNSYTQPPTSVSEYDVQRKLLLELEALDTDEALQEWYFRTKPEQDQVTSQSMRNVLFDAIRAKKTMFLERV